MNTINGEPVSLAIKIKITQLLEGSKPAPNSSLKRKINMVHVIPTPEQNFLFDLI